MTGLVFYAFSAALALAVYTFLTSVITVRGRIRQAQATGLPYIVRPCKEFNYIYLVLQPVISALLPYIPQWLDPVGYRNFFDQDWRFLQKWRKHEDYGPLYWNISPGTMALEIADANVYLEVLTTKATFVKDLSLLASVSIYGPNIVASEGDMWKRHRRVIGQEFTEDVHGFAWRHATQLASEMFAGWNTPAHPVEYKPGTNPEVVDLRTLALRVVAGAALEIKIPFSTAAITDDNLVPAAKFSDDLQDVLENLMTFLIFPRWAIALKTPALLDSFDYVGTYMRQMIAAEQQSIKEAAKTERSLLGGLVNAIAPDDSKQLGSKQLTYEEVTGNVFLLGLAGSETTAHTIHYALVLLATYQQEQDYVLEELDSVREQAGDEWEYKTIFPKLKRMQNVMFECLRLCPPVPIQTRTSVKSHTLTYESRPLRVPVGTLAVLNITGLQCNPEYWGETAAEFQPKRWENNSHTEGSFGAFGHGPHACLGRRFSEAEFVAVMSELLRDWRVELVPLGQETEVEAARRVRAAVDNSHSYMTLSVGGDVPLRFVARR